MRFQDKLKNTPKEQVWQEYCGFMDLPLDEFMYIQRRLMDEQIRLWKDCGLGKKLLAGRSVEKADDFREAMPLTSYVDYADTLLARRTDMLPGEAITWIQTTWEGGLHPIKLAPYTREMLDVYRRNVVAVTMLASGRRKGEFTFRRGDRILYGGAPLPYATGLLPTLLGEDIDLEWLPDSDANSGLSFSARIKKGFRMSMNGGIDFFFAIGSVANYITENFASSLSGGDGTGKKERLHISPAILLRYLKAKSASRESGIPIQPKDIYRIKGFVSTGTDAQRYRDSLAAAWGVEPIEIAAGTESTCIATGVAGEIGMVFFPDACFYEFIPEEETRLNLADSSYTPRTCLMDEVRAGENYELVISVFHGGAFMRYRIGDMYHCLSAQPGKLPRFTFMDRTPDVIDIAGFTRITEASIEEVIAMSKVGVGEWLAKKELDGKGIPFLHMYVEVTPDSQSSDITRKQLLTEHLSVYFKFFDSDYNDLKLLLGMEPLVVTILKYGTIASYRRATGRILPRINPGMMDVQELIRHQTRPVPAWGGDES